jgi:hypothetical protein
LNTCCVPNSGIAQKATRRSAWNTTTWQCY